MFSAEDEQSLGGARGGPPTLEIVVPVYNEERELARSVGRLRHYLDSRFPLTTIVTIADNASTDTTWPIAQRLAEELAGVRAVHLDQKGRGRALRSVWSVSEARIVAYMDVDLSTDLDALFPLVAPLISGHSDLAIGTRLAAGARVIREPRRELISRCYNLIVKAALRSRVSDAQCGFKAVTTDAARALLPLVEDEGWFFDTELLILAERNGLRIHEVPVDWVDGPDSTVDIAHTAAADLRGIGRLLREFAKGKGRTELATRRPFPGTELVSFARIGALSTAAWLVLWLALRPAVGAVAANALALVVCSLANTAANRVLTFAAQAPFRRRDQVLGGLAVLGASLLVTNVALAIAISAGATSALPEAVALLVANAIVAFARFVILRAWAFRRVRSDDRAPEATPEPQTAER
jgi:putative flippase GtrA